MKIEEIKGYLGTGVNYYLLDSFIQRKVELTVYNLESFLRGDYQLILHPLSDLIKYCEDLGFVPNIELSSLGFGMDNFDEDYTFEDFLNSDILNNSFAFIQQLLEWHFDIHNLIEKGEAIDINTL